MKLRSAFVAMAAGSAIAACNPSASSPSGSGGHMGTGSMTGSGGNGSGGSASCSSGTLCGGDVVGTWTVSTSCLSVTGQLDLSAIGAHCPAAPITGSLTVSGTWTANADGTSKDDTTTLGQEQFSFSSACQSISSTPVTCEGMADTIKTLGYETVTCTGTSGCTCSATVKQKGDLGIVSGSPSTSGNYMRDGNVLTVVGDSEAKYGYCVSGSTLTLTPQDANPAVMGKIVLQKGSVIATGGVGPASGSGGMIGTGGMTGSGGKPGSGGQPASGGTTGGAGRVGSGGQPASGGTTGGAGRAGGSGGSDAGGAPGTTGMGPCDLYKAGGTPCVTAHSTVRALFSAYSGKLYQVRNSAMTTKDINTVAPGGVADGAAQDTFCSGTTCVITILYDQTSNGNDLWYEGQGSMVGGGPNMHPATATKDPIKIGGSKAYGLYIEQQMAYWADGSKKGMPLGAAPQGIYMVASGTHNGSICCFDYGNGETGRAYVPGPSMDALNFSTIATWQMGAGKGPWVLADLEGGLYSSGDKTMDVNPDVPSMAYPFVTAAEKNNGTTEFTLRGSDATAGSLKTFYKGKLPDGYSPMKKQGSIVLGSGGDCCLTNTNLGSGTFYEGAVVAGYPTDAVEEAIHANVVAAKYSK
jgi:hypothetical protein